MTPLDRINAAIRDAGDSKGVTVFREDLEGVLAELEKLSPKKPDVGEESRAPKRRGQFTCAECGEPRSPYCRCDEDWFFDMDGKA